MPQGGIVAATAARAMEAALGEPAQPLRSLNAVFAGQVRARPGRDRGRRCCGAAVRCRRCARRCAIPGADAGFDALGRVRGRARRVHVHRRASCRTGCAPPLECPSFRDPPPDGFDDRTIRGSTSGSTSKAARRSATRRGRTTSPSRRCGRSGTASTIRPAPTTAPGIRSRSSRSATRCRARSANGSGPRRDRQWLPPSADFTVHVLGEARADWVLAVNRARHAGDGYASADMEIWDVERAPRLVAYGTQTMVFSFPK